MAPAASPNNADLIRPIYKEWGGGNWRTRFDVYHPQMEWGWSDEFPGLAGVYHDRRDPNPRLLTWLSEWEQWRVEADDYLEIDDHVVVLTSNQGRGKGSGVHIRQAGAHVFELRHGKVVRLEIFADRKKAMESARAAAYGSDFARDAALLALAARGEGASVGIQIHDHRVRIRQ